MAARTSTAKALAAQIPGFTAASATGATHLIVASAVASSALVGTAAITTKLEQRPSHPAAPAHATPNPRPANPASDRSSPASSGTGTGSGAHRPDTTVNAGQTGAQGPGTDHAPQPVTGQGAGQGTATHGAGQGAGQTSGQGTTQRTTPPPPSGKPTTRPAPKDSKKAPSSGSGSAKG
jgi:hypothetical protein